MKTRILLTTLGVAALTAITFNANGALLSPRAMGNQINTIAGPANGPNLVAVNQGLARVGVAPARWAQNRARFARAFCRTKEICRDGENSLNMAATLTGETTLSRGTFL